MATSPPVFWSGIPSSKLYPLLSLDRLGVVPRLIGLGVGRIQVREKGGSWGRSWKGLQAAAGACRDAGVVLVINDRADVALALGIRAVHVGQEDLPPGAVRRILGPGSEIGLSCGTQEEVDRALTDPEVDLIAIGPVFPTPIKPGVPAVGLDLVRRNAGRGKPLVAIGGIGASNAREVMRAGADLLAAVRAVEDWLS